MAQMVDELICTDINRDLLFENCEKMTFFKNISFEFHDFREIPYPRRVDAIYLIDTIEHIYPEEESEFMDNLCKSLTEWGVCIIGTPNKLADKYANDWSHKGHVNLKDNKELMSMVNNFFHKAFFFGMNDEMIHTGFPPMTHFMWALCIGPKEG